MKQTKSHGLTGMVVPVIGALGLFAIATLLFADTMPQSQPTIVQPRLQRTYVYIRSNTNLATLGQFLSTRALPQHEQQPPRQLRFADPALQRTVAVTGDGTIWCASLYNGNQQDDHIERAARYGRGSVLADGLQVPVLGPPHNENITEVSAGSGGVWFTVTAANLVGHVAANGSVVEYPSRFDGTLPDFPAVAPDGSVWFAELGPSKIAHLNRSGVIEGYPRQGTFDSVGPLVLDHSGNLWFLEPHAGKIGRIHLATGVTSEYAVPVAKTQLTAIGVGPDDTIWFTDAESQALGRLDPASQDIAEYPQPSQFSPKCLAVSGSGIVWFCTKVGLGRFDPTSQKTTIIPLVKAFPPNRIVAGYEDEIWFTSGGGIGSTRGDGRAVQRYIPNYQATGYRVTVYTKDLEAYTRKHPHYGGDLSQDTTGPERRVVEYTDVSSDLTFYGAAWAPEGTLWMIGDDSLAQFVPATRRVTKFRRPAAESSIFSVVADHHQRLWLVEQNRLIRLNTAGVIDRIIYPSQPGIPNDIAVGRDDSLWLALLGAIVNLRADGSSATYPIGEEGPFAITIQPTGEIWFTTRSRVARLRPSTGEITKIALPFADAAPMAIITAHDGSIWFTDAAGRIGKLSANGGISEFTVPTKNGIPFALSSSSTGKIWFTEFYGAKLGIVDTATNRINEIAVPWADAFPLSIAVDQDGWVRFSDANGIFGTYDPSRSRFQPSIIPTPVARGG